MAYVESNGNVIDDVTWPRKVTFVTTVRLPIENSWRCYLSSTVGCPSDSLACCFSKNACLEVYGFVRT